MAPIHCPACHHNGCPVPGISVDVPDPDAPSDYQSVRLSFSAFSLVPPPSNKIIDLAKDGTIHWVGEVAQPFLRHIETREQDLHVMNRKVRKELLACA